jgi:hypothetical protein
MPDTATTIFSSFFRRKYRSPRKKIIERTQKDEFLLRLELVEKIWDPR